MIVGFNGQKVDALHDLTRLVADTRAGTKVDMKVWRDKKKETLTCRDRQAEGRSAWPAPTISPRLKTAPMAAR